MPKVIAPRPGYDQLTVYRNEGKSFPIDLTDNTNLFGSAPSAVASLAEWASRSPARYPTLVTEDLRAALADSLRVRPDQVLGGCGSNDLLDSAMRALGRPGAQLAYAAPTFVMTPHFAGANSLVAVPVPTDIDGAADVDALLATKAPIIYVANPNNPAGAAASKESLIRLLDGAPGIVIVDEAYIEFGGDTMAAEALERGNVIITRTFSKVWGLAGLRLGYAIAAAPLITELEKARGPYKVNAVAELAAAAAVRHDQGWVADIVRRTVAMRRSVTDRLTAIGFKVRPSAANFIAVTVADARQAGDQLAERGIGVRAFPKTPVLGDLLRVTIGPEEMMDPFISAMAEVAR